MRITVLTEYFPTDESNDVTGGVEARCFFLGRALARKHAVTVVTSWQPGLKRQAVVAGMHIVRVGPAHAYTNEGHGAFASRLGFAVAAAHAAARIPADVVDGANFISYLPAFLAARAQRIAAVATYHEVWLGNWVRHKGLLTGCLGEAWERAVLKCPWHRIIAVSAFTARELGRQGVRSNLVSVVPNGIDMAEFREPGDEIDRPSICCVARLTPGKRVGDLLQAFAILKERYPKLGCQIVGSGPEESSLKRLALDLGIARHVAFLGRLDRVRLIETIRRCSVFCLPSDTEGFGIAVLEAMAAGVPYVCADIPPLREATAGGVGGILCPPRDPRQLAVALDRILADPGLARSAATAGRQYAAGHDWALLAENVTEEYRRARSEANLARLTQGFRLFDTWP